MAHKLTLNITDKEVLNDEKNTAKRKDFTFQNGKRQARY
jgi:hypothetical protein